MLTPAQETTTMAPLTIGYSTCPNDTFAFDALAHFRVPMEGLTFAVTLADVEQLNQWALEGRLDVSKLSFAAFGHLQDHYALIDSGGAMGRGCGPLVVARPATDPAMLKQGRIAIPGQYTTAHLLAALYLGHPPRHPQLLPFDCIIPAVSDGRAEVGVIIHEGRFTYAAHGLVALVDLGAWWEAETGLPIPLGAIAVHRRVPAATAAAVERVVRSSVAFARENPDASSGYVARHAQEMDPAVVRQHIDLYVNDFSRRYGDQGKAAIRELLARARAAGLMPDSGAPLFVA
jgi:1,4-dihydroxy-6-naphthoate synthase